MGFLTKAQAHAQAERLAHHIRKYGVPVVIDLRTGAGGRHWGVDTFYGAMAHHIVSRRSQGLTPFYSLVRNGRVDVPGPLCNVYGGWDRVARIVTMGLANHPGAGGPWTVSGFRIPQDNGRYYFLGTEFEGGWNEADWDDDYRTFMGAVNAGKLDYIRELRGIPIADTALCEHSDWARPKGRKIDRLGYTQARGIAEMQEARGSGVAGITIPPSHGPEEGTDTMRHYIFTHGPHQYWLNPRDWTIRPIEGRHDSGASHRAEIKTLVEATGDTLHNWRDRPNAGSKSDELAAVGNFAYVGPESTRPKGA